DYGAAVPIAQQLALDHGLEQPLTCRKPRFDPLEGGLEGKCGKRVDAVKPGPQGVQHEGQSAREAAGVLLSHAELDGVERCFHRSSVYSIRCQPRERVEDEGLDLTPIGGSNAFETRGKHRLPQILVNSAAREVLAEAGLEQCL